MRNPKDNDTLLMLANRISYERDIPIDDFESLASAISEEIFDDVDSMDVRRVLSLEEEDISLQMENLSIFY
jgi:hypothetical protein